MAELPIISFIASVQTVAAGAAVRSSEQNPAAGLAALPAGTFLSGTVVNRDAKGNPVLRTDKGDLTLKSDFFLKIGAAVVIRVESQNDVFKARIVSIDGQSPGALQQPVRQEDQVAVPTSLLKQESIAPGEQAPARPLAAPLAPAALIQQSLKVLLASPLPLPETVIAQLPPTLIPALKGLSTGVQLTVRIVALELPANDSAAAPAAKPQAAPVAPSYAAYAKQIAPAPAAALANLPAPPPATAAPAPNNSPPVQTTVPNTPPLPLTLPVNPKAPAFLPLEGLIISPRDAKEPLLQTPLGVIRLPVGTSLPPGTKVSFELTEVQKPVTSAAPFTPIVPAEDGAPDLQHPWQALSQAAALLQQTAPDLAAAFQRQIPTLGAQLATGTLFFIAALKGGDLRHWLGEKTVQQLQDLGQGELLGRIAKEFGAARSALVDQPANPAPGSPAPWQMVLMPMMYQEEIQPARLFVKKDGGQKSEQGKQETGGTRFVLELELSELGPLQMDGFVRKQQQKSSFDLMIRSIRGLSPSMEADITAIFNEAAQLTGFAGSVQFQTTRHFPVNPLEEVMSERQRTIIA